MEIAGTERELMKSNGDAGTERELMKSNGDCWCGKRVNEE